MTSVASPLATRHQALLLLVASVMGAGCEGSVLCTPGACSNEGSGPGGTIVEVSAASVSVKLTGVSTEDINGHDVNGAYTAFRCGTP